MNKLTFICLLIVFGIVVYGCEEEKPYIEGIDPCLVFEESRVDIDGNYLDWTFEPCREYEIGTEINEDTGDLVDVVKTFKTVAPVTGVDLRLLDDETYLMNNSGNILKQKYTIDESLEAEFFDKHPDWYVVDKLNSILKINGEFKAKATGSIDSSSATTGFLFSRYTQTESRVNLNIDGDFTAIGISELPLIWINESEFMGLVDKYDVVAVKCIYDSDVGSVVYDSFDASPTNLFCAFERENIQFLTTIDSINELVYTCEKNIPIKIYIQSGSWMAIPFTIYQEDWRFGYCREVYDKKVS